MTEPDQKPAADRGSPAKPSALGRAGSEIWRVIRPTGAKFATLAVTTLAVLVLLVLVAPETFRGQVSRVHHALLWWSLPDELSGGLIRVSAPRIFTRERLVNDRFDEAAWLQQRLRDTGTLLKDGKFAEPDQVRLEWTELADPDRNRRMAAARQGQTDEGTGSLPAAAGDQGRLALSQQLQLERANSYRDVLRRRLMSENLDDTHDIQGNTLYRFDLAASVVPPPYSDAVAVIELTVREQGPDDPPNDDDYILASYGELLEEWRDEIERQSLRLSADRMRILRSSDDQPIDGAFEQLDADFFDYAVSVLEELLPANGTGGAAAVEIIRLNRQIYLAFAEQQIRDHFFRQLPVELHQANVSLQLGAYRFFCEEGRDVIKANDLRSVFYIPSGQDTGNSPSQAELDRLQIRCQPWSHAWGIKADLELLRALRGFAASVGQDQLKTCLASVDLRGLLRSRTNLWPPYQYLYSLAEDETHCYLFSGYDNLRRLSDLSLPWDNLSVEVARYIWHTISENSSKNLAGLKLKDFFEFYFDECTPIDCFFRIGIKGKEAIDRKQTAKKLREQLNGGARALSYSFTPDEGLLYADQWTGHAVVVQLDQFGQRLSQRSEAATRGIAATSGIVGFGDWGGGAPPSGGAQTRLGWLVFSGADNLAAGSPPPKHFSLSALVSLPSWWRKVVIEVKSCWLPRAYLGHLGNADPCAGTAAETDTESLIQATQRMRLHLPGTATDISQRLMFEVVKYPFVDARPGDTLRVEIGRDARLAISGGRLWKSPRVQLGDQWADRVQVLPDMHGLIAEFTCVEPPIDLRMDGPPDGRSTSPEKRAEGGAAAAGADPGLASDDGALGNGAPTRGGLIGPPRTQRGPVVFAPLRIWTSEGVTKPLTVQFFAFQRRHDEEADLPCLHWSKPQSFNGPDPADNG